MKYLIMFTALWVVLTSAIGAAGSLSESEKQFLAVYEKARTALADLGSEGADLAKSNSLKEARAAFEKLGDKAKQLATGQSGYYVAHCPMLKKDWVQTSEKIANPYYGKEMASCGEIKK